MPMRFVFHLFAILVKVVEPAAEGTPNGKTPVDGAVPHFERETGSLELRGPPPDPRMNPGRHELCSIEAAEQRLKHTSTTKANTPDIKHIPHAKS